MVRRFLTCCVVLMLAGLFLGCGHTQTSTVGLISFGDLEGKTIPDGLEGPILEGSDAAKIGGSKHYYLSNAARNALSGGQYDTLVDVEVTTKTGFTVPSNKITVRGRALNSNDLESSGENP